MTIRAAVLLLLVVACVTCSARADDPEPTPEQEVEQQRADLVAADEALAAGLAAQDDALLARALARYEAHIDVSASPGLLFHAYVKRVEAELALRRHADAARHAEELTWVMSPYEPADAAERAALDALVLETCVRAFALWARALVALERPGEALDALAQLDRRPGSKGWREHALAPLLDVERAAALCALGRGAEAGALLEALVTRARAAPEAEHVTGLGMARQGALACRALADLDLRGGLPLDEPALAFDTGLGHLLAGRRDHALAAWKRVLAVASTPEARARWALDAAERAGKLLAAQERWLEAALALHAGLVLAPGPRDDVARLALSCATRAVRQLGEELSGDGPTARLWRQVQAAAGGGGADDVALAQDLERAGRWEEAAAAWLQVPESSPRRGQGLLRAGECLLRAHRAGAAGALPRAREALHLVAGAGGPGAASRGATGPAGSSRGSSRGSDALRAQAACALAEVELEAGAVRDAAAALDRVAIWPEALRVRAARLRARALLARGRPPAEAMPLFRDVAALADDPHHARFAVELAGALREAAAAALERPPLDAPRVTLARALLRDAGTCVRAWAARPGADPDALSPGQALWAARALLEGGRAVDAVALYRSALTRSPVPADEDGQRARTRAETELAWCLLVEEPRAAWEAFVALRDAVTLRDARGRVTGRGALVERRVTGPFRKVVEGRETQVMAWITVVRFDDGAERSYVDVTPAQRDDRFQAVEGLDPTRAWTNDEARTLSLEGRRAPLVVLGLQRAMWARWTQEGDRGLLAREALPAAGAALALVRAQDEAGWLRLVAALPDEPEDLALRRWDAELRLLEVKLALERWAEAASDVRLLRLLRTPLEVPEALAPRWAAILRGLEGRAPTGR